MAGLWLEDSSLLKVIDLSFYLSFETAPKFDARAPHYVP